MNATIEKLVALFGQGWTAAHFSAAAEYNGLYLKVAWVPSTNLNSQGQPYKNVASISQA